MPHARASEPAANRGRLVAVLVLTLAILALEVVGGIVANSLALLADAGHMLTDVVGVGMALLAIWFAGRSPTNGRTYGYLRVEILAAVTNAFLLFGVAAFILQVAAWWRPQTPRQAPHDRRRSQIVRTVGGYHAPFGYQS
jgi:cobalt-zinc-cadmium efflux system protein